MKWKTFAKTIKMRMARRIGKRTDILTVWNIAAAAERVRMVKWSKMSEHVLFKL